MRGDLHFQIQVACRAAAHAGTALTGQPNALTRRGAGRQPHIQRLAVFETQTLAGALKGLFERDFQARLLIRAHGLETACLEAPRSRSFEARSFEAVGADQQTSLEITLEEAFQGARKSLRFENGKSLDVRLPAGATPGQRIRLAGQGSPGMGGGSAGDLYLEVQIAPHDYFRLDGRDVLLELPVTPWEAALGATITAPTLGGKVDVKVPAGSGSGRKLRLKGRGLPGGTPGDQMVIVQIHTPPADTEAAREVYRRMAEELPFDPRSHLR